jgi:hypothetical protein
MSLLSSWITSNAAQIIRLGFGGEERFQPEYAHAIFEDEQIFGYRGLNLHLTFAPDSMRTLVEITHDEVIDDPDHPADDIRALLTDAVASGNSLADVSRV